MSPNPLSVAAPPIADAPRGIEPDALFAVGERYFALEADSGHFGADNLFALFVTANEKRMRDMVKAVESIARNGRSARFALRAGQTSPASCARRLRKRGRSGSRGAGSDMRICESMLNDVDQKPNNRSSG
jgi:hypothetical protein